MGEGGNVEQARCLFYGKSKKEIMDKIALFGTSADPPTKGHQIIIKWLSDNFDKVAVWASDNPFKSHHASLEMRSQMLEILIKEIQPPRDNILVCAEISSHRTLETVQRARSKWTKWTLALVVGADIAGQLPDWYKIEELLEQVGLLVVPRPGYSIKEADLEKLRQLGAKVEIAAMEGPDVSSTAYRQRKDVSNLTPAIKAFIGQDLY